MKCTKKERLNISRRIYDGEISLYKVAEEYDIGEQTARNYMRMYRDANQLPLKNNARNSHIDQCTNTTPADMEEFESMTKEELIHELVKARITEARLKKDTK